MQLLAALFILAQQVEPATTLPMPAFLEGCWEETRDGGYWTVECWSDARGGVMTGFSRSGRGDLLTSWEWMRIERGDGGALALHASPNGSREIAFAASQADHQSVTFSNARHDYPQRLRYAAHGHRLHVEIALADGSRPSRWRFQRKATPVK